jgi:MFS family permease
MNDDSGSSWPTPRYAWYTIIVLLVAYTLAFIDRVILSLLVEPIRRDLGISDTQMSLLHGFAFAIFYSLLGIPIARLADRRDRRLIIGIGVAFWSIMNAMCGLARSFWEMFAARVGVGIGEAALSPAAYSIIADSFRPGQLGRAIGVYSAAIYGGAGLALIGGGTVAALVSDATRIEIPLLGSVYPWQVVFFVTGLPGLLVAAWVLSLREPARQGKAVTLHPSIADLVQQLRSRARAYASHIFGFTLLGITFNATLAWSPTHLMRSFGWDAPRAAFWLGSVMLVFGSVGIILGGVLTDRWRRAGWQDSALRVGVVSGVGLAPFALAAPLVGDPMLAVALYAPFLFFSAFAFGAAVTALQIMTPPTLRAQVSSLFLLSMNLLALGAGPLLTALLTDYLFGSDLRVGDSLAIVGTIGALSGAALLYSGLRPFREAVAAQSA